MEKFTQKYTIVQLLEDLPDGAEYDRADWPLHVTLADVFAASWSEDQLIKHLEEFCTKQKNFIYVRRKRSSLWTERRNSCCYPEIER